jgi:IS605 OrfB family transposase
MGEHQISSKSPRQYALHELTTRLTQKYDLIFIEDLNVKALSRGRNARSIQDASFGEIRRQLTYKSEWHDKILIAVDRWYASSKTCSNCRHVLDELRLDVRFWTCPKCKACHDRDINAARNLLMEGLRQLAAREERDLRVDAGDACPEEILVQVLAEGDGVQFTRSGQCHRACLEQARWH